MKRESAFDRIKKQYASDNPPGPIKASRPKWVPYAEKLKDPRWQRKRLEVLSSDNFTCTCCGSTDIELHVHHFEYAKSGNPWDADLGDMCTLCKDCHYVFEKSFGLGQRIVTHILFTLKGQKEIPQYWRRAIIKEIVKYTKEYEAN